MSTYALFDDAGRFLAGRVMSETDASLQVELDSGKRVKVKSGNVMLRFDKPAPAELLARAQELSSQIDLDLAWEFAPASDFGFADLARDYFEPSAGPEKQAAALLRLFEAPHYFRRLGKGLFRKAPEETVKAALLAIERKKQVAAQIGAWADELIAGRCPAPVREQLYRILFKPDKQSAEYKSVVDAAKRSQRAPLDLLQRAGAIDSPYQFHWRRFLFEMFPLGTGFPKFDLPASKDTLPIADGVHAFSIDDSQTTEIDDALSVRGLGSGSIGFGIHIAAPGLVIAPDSALDRIARERLSTVYMPGGKITMLPEALVEACTLTEGRDCAAVSLYLTVDEATLEIRGHETRIERVHIAANLRHDKLDAVITEDALTATAPADFAFADELKFAYRLALACKARREAVRGKPETFNRPDYSFKLERDADATAANAEPRGDERVSIVPRRRGAPLDLIVAEAMILANSTWGGWLAELGVPAIYRSQASLAPGIKVRMGTKPLPHAGMGVAQYAWSTSPLRRMVDLANQWQIIACARHGRTAALAAPFKPKDAALFALISAFDAAYAAYADFQHGIERFWTLRWLEQNTVAELDAAVIKPGLVRAETLPLVFTLPGTDGVPRGTRVRARITGMDLLTLDLHASLVARLDDAPAALADAADEAEDGEGQSTAAGPLHLAIDLADAPEGAESADGGDRAGPAAAPAEGGRAMKRTQDASVVERPGGDSELPEWQPTQAVEPATPPPPPPAAASAMAQPAASAPTPFKVPAALAIPFRFHWRDLRNLSTLHWALLISFSVHGALLTFRFVDPERFNRVFKDTPLEVILVNARSAEAPDIAQAIAQARLAGGGEADKGRATSPLPPALTTEIGDSTDDAKRRIDQLQHEQQQLLAMLRREVAALPPPDPRRDQGEPDEREKEERRRQLLRQLAEIEKRVNEENARPKKRYISPSTREEVYALYYDGLRRRIEERGTRNFPESQGRKLYGELVMNVTIDAQGRVIDTEIVRSSRSRVLDTQAMAIVRAAAPFGSFTQAMRVQAEQIVVTSRFRFTRDEGLETTQLAR